MPFSRTARSNQSTAAERTTPARLCLRAEREVVFRRSTGAAGDAGLLARRR